MKKEFKKYIPEIKEAISKMKMGFHPTFSFGICRELFKVGVPHELLYGYKDTIIDDTIIDDIKDHMLANLDWNAAHKSWISDNLIYMSIDTIELITESEYNKTKHQNLVGKWLVSKKSDETELYWFPCDKKHWSLRIEILESYLEELEKL